MSNPVMCAFCGRAKAQVRNLIAGDALGTTSVGICELCVGQSFDMLVQSGALAPKVAPPKDVDAGSAIRNAVRTMPRSVDVAALVQLAAAGMTLAAGNAAALRILSYDLGNAMAFEVALEVRAGIATFERAVSDYLAESAYLTRIGRSRDGLTAIEQLTQGHLTAKMSEQDRVAASMARMYAQLGAQAWGTDVRAIEAELAAIAPKLATVVTDTAFRRALENQVVHVRALGAMLQGRDADAVRMLTEQLAVRELDIEALALLVEAYDRTGDRASAERAREKAMKHVPLNSAYAKRLAGARRG